MAPGSWLPSALVGFAAILTAGCTQSEQASPPTVAAAASLVHVMPELIERFAPSATSTPITVTYGASGVLRQQVEAGAPVDAVVLAAGEMVDDLIGEGLAVESSRRVIATNELVLVGPSGSAPLSFRSLDRLPDQGRIAIGDPGSVPAGRYAQEAIDQCGLWRELQGKLVYGGDVTRVLVYARRGEVDAAVVYTTDVMGLDDITILDRAGWPDAPRPEVVAAGTVSGQSRPEVAGFLEFLDGPEARAIFRAHGFGPPPGS